MDTPAPNPQKLLVHWMEWEKGEIPPGELMKQLKMGGMRTLLEELAQTQAEAAAPDEAETVADLLD